MSSDEHKGLPDSKNVKSNPPDLLSMMTAASSSSLSCYVQGLSSTAFSSAGPTSHGHDHDAAMGGVSTLNSVGGGDYDDDCLPRRTLKDSVDYETYVMRRKQLTVVAECI